MKKGFSISVVGTTVKQAYRRTILQVHTHELSTPVDGFIVLIKQTMFSDDMERIGELEYSTNWSDLFLAAYKPCQ